MDSFVKRHDYLVCVDSDGCAMDTMNCKHIHCFGPCMVAEWGLELWKDEILRRWNEINLFRMTRGINRFKGLALALEEIHEKHTPVSGLAALQHWVRTTPALSEDNLEAAIKSCRDSAGRACLKKALTWSRAANAAISALPEELKRPFSGAGEGLAAARACADVAVVTSANRNAVEDEWTRHGLLAHVDILLAQDCGSKAHCIGEMMKFGYAPDHVLMVGDAPGDRDAAAENGALFFPILVGHEAESWAELRNIALQKLLERTYDGAYQALKETLFRMNLGG